MYPKHPLHKNGDREFFLPRLEKPLLCYNKLPSQFLLAVMLNEEKKHTKQSSCSFFLLNTIHISHHHHSHSHRPHPLPPHQHMRQASPL